MQIKIYNEGGKIKVTKIGSGNIEQTIFSNIEDGKVATITVEVNTSPLVAHAPGHVPIKPTGCSRPGCVSAQTAFKMSHNAKQSIKSELIDVYISP